MLITFEIIIDEYAENKYARRDLSITFKRVMTEMRQWKWLKIIKWNNKTLKIIPSEPKKWGILKYLSAEISSETTTLLGK